MAGELRWDHLFEQSPLSTQVFAPDGRTIRFNRAWERLFGLSREEAYAFNVLEASDFIESGAIHGIRKAFAGEGVGAVQLTVARTGGSLGAATVYYSSSDGAYRSVTVGAAGPRSFFRLFQP